MMLALPAPPSAPILGEGVDVCALVEGFPGPKAAIRKIAPFKRGFSQLEKSRGKRRNLRRAKHALEQASSALLAKARGLMGRQGPVAEDRADKRKIRRFLDAHIMTPTPTLLIVNEGFTLPPTITTTLATLACRLGHPAEAITLARRHALKSPRLTAFAALLLIDQDRPQEARELLPHLGTQGFLAPFVRTELIADPQEKLRFFLMARDRAQSSLQRLASHHQQARHPTLHTRQP